jgi:hypothetical protein
MANYAEVRVTKSGPGGRPYAEVLVDGNVNTDKLGKIVQGVTRNKDLLRKLGLKACAGCKSGFDINIRDRFEEVMRVEF